MKATLDAKAAVGAYHRAFQTMKILPGFSHREILRAEAGVILKTWAGETKVSTQDRADRGSRLRAIRGLGLTGGKRNPDADITVNAGIRGPYGRVFMRKRNSQSLSGRNRWRRTHEAGFKPLWQHYKRGDWIDLQEAVGDVKRAVAREIPMGRGSIGLSRQSVVQIADDLRIDLGRVAGGRLSPAGLAKARAAIASNGRSYRNGQGSQGGDEIRFQIHLLNRLPYNAKIGMDRQLVSILQRRAKFIETAYAKGAFRSIDRAARSFPNLFNTSRLTA